MPLIWLIKVVSDGAKHVNSPKVKTYICYRGD
jgi:hypothetical protein